MSDQEKKITREELYQELWQTPMSKFAAKWGVPIASIVKAANLMSVPRPGSGHWQLVARGWDVEREPLPAANVTTPASAEIKAAQKRIRVQPAQKLDENPPAKPQIEIPENLDNVHRLVKQTFRALTHDTYLHHGLVQARSGDKPLSVEVSPEQVKRALRIMAAIVKAVIDLGGRFQQGPESWRWRLIMGKQPVWFWITEVKKRLTIDPELDEEERKAKGYFRWDKYEWKGSGLLRFSIGGEEHVNGRVWTETKRNKMENFLSEIIGCLAQAEDEAEKNRTTEAERKKVEAEEQRKRDIEWRREYVENEKRKALEETSERWQRARVLRDFIRACEGELQKRSKLVPESPAALWLVWAGEHANRLDPLEQGYLRNLVKPGTEEEPDYQD